MRKNKIKKWFVTFCLFFVVCMIWNSMEVKAWWDPEETGETEEDIRTEWDTATAVEETIGAFTYHAYPSRDGMSVWIYEIGVNKTKKHNRLEIPQTIQGKTVTRIGDSRQFDSERDYDKNVFGEILQVYEDYFETGNPNKKKINEIKEIILPDTIKVIQAFTFDSMEGIRKIKIPDQVEKISAWTFYYCINLKEITLPESLNYLDPTAFELCKRLEKFTISSKNHNYVVKKGCVIDKRKQALVCVTGKKQDVFKIPKGIKILKSGALGNCSADRVEIPASVTKIEPMAFERSYMENKRIKDVTVSKKNKVYAKDGQCIYDKKTKKLVVAIPHSGKLRISDKVQVIDLSDYSTVNFNFKLESLEYIVYPKRLKKYLVGGLGMGADKIYYTAPDVPKLGINKSNLYCEYRIKPPETISANAIYVPAKSEKKYKKWYKKYEGYKDAMKIWHTYDPATLK